MKSAVATGSLPSVVGAGFGMDEYAEKFRGSLFKADFEFGLNIVDA